MKELDITRLEEQRRYAFEGRDGLRYRRLCDLLGVEPECTDLYDSGADIRYISKRNTQSSNLNSNRSLFVSDVEERGVNVADFSADNTAKSELLIKYFPKFREDGKQPISGYTPAEVGKIFKRVLDSAHRQIKQ